MPCGFPPKLEKAKDICLLIFWGTAYFLKAIIEIPWLLLKSWFNNDKR